jgi:uncharacterized protein YbaP (TraB family)
VHAHFAATARRPNMTGNYQMHYRWPLTAFLLLLLAAVPALPQPADPEIVVVTGRQPGPPLWRVSNGDNTLYIFPTLSPVPEGMIWDSERVAYVLEESQQALLAPDVDADFSTTLMLNPINWIRGARLARQLTRNPNDETLEDVLPPELFARYEALKAQYFPRDRDAEELRPLFAGTRLADRILREEGLVSGDEITKQVERLMRRNRDLERTEIEVVVDLKGSFKSLAERIETLVASLPQEQELECFEEQIRRVESELDAMKSRANAWAQGYVDEFRGISLPGDDQDACVLLLYQSSEFETLEQVRNDLNRRWLAAAEQALAANTSTFAILDIVDLLREDGLLAQLEARGYEIREP